MHVSSGPPPRPPSWPAAARGTALLSSPVSPAPRRQRRSFTDSLRSAARHHLATTSLTKRSARPNAAARRQLHFGLQLCHTVAALPAWYYTPRMHACMQPIMQATRRQAQPRRPSVHSAWPLSCLSRPSRFVPAAPALLAAPLAPVRDRESWAHIRPSAIPDLPFLQADWS